MLPRAPSMLISVDVTVTRPVDTSQGFPTSGRPGQLVGGNLGCCSSGGAGGGMGPCQSKWTMPNRVPGREGLGSGTICVPFAATVAVPYGTIRPSVGSSVIRVMLVPGRVLRVFG